MIPADNLLEVYGDRGTIRASSDARTYRLQSLDGNSFPWGDTSAACPPGRARTAGGLRCRGGAGVSLRAFPSYFAHWVTACSTTASR